MLNSFLNADSEIPRLTKNEARIYDRKLTVDECSKSLQLFESSKLPGNDGLTAKCYRAFWRTLGIVWLYGELSNSQKEAITILIEKKR